jgi:hypothetical protein
VARRALRFHLRRAGAAGIIAVGLAAAAAGCGAPAVSGGPGHDRVLVCESGIRSHEGVRTSSAVAVHVPAGTPVPPGCRLA